MASLDLENRRNRSAEITFDQEDLKTVRRFSAKPSLFRNVASAKQTHTNSLNQDVYQMNY
jgi:hypothetical protein